MKLSNIPTIPYRPQVKRLSQKELPLPQTVNEFDSPSSTRKWFTRPQGRISPNTEQPWMNTTKSENKHDNHQKNKFNRRACFWITVAIICLLIVGAIIGIVLGLTLPIRTDTTSLMTSSISTTNAASSTTVATTTLTSMACSNIGHGSLAFQNQSTPTSWTSYLFTFSATKTAPTLVFGFETDGTNSFYLDSVSVTDNTASTIQLLTNRNFENSTTIPTGWITSCELTSCGSSASRIETNSLCSSGNCFESFCSAGRSSLIFLSQTFTTTSGHLHTVTYMLKRTAISSTGIMAFYLDVI